jgi:potassium channel LctB
MYKGGQAMGHFLLFLLSLPCTLLMTASVIHLCQIKRAECPLFSWQHFTILLMVYFILILGFSILYLGLSLLGYPSIASHGEQYINSNGFYYIGNIIYFSSVTMLTIGYGDMTPLGLAKVFVVIQALLGYLLPAAFLVSGIASTMEKKDTC